jgi:hypothetical protein
VFLTIVLPLALPTVLYLLWLQAAHRPRSWRVMPFVWLVGAGVVLLAIVLFVVTVHFGTPQTGVYVPPRVENGRIVPGHIEPAKKP